MRRRRAATPERPPAAVPDVFLYPRVEDWVRPDEQPVDLGLSPMYRRDEMSDVGWRFRQLAEQRFAAALLEWRREHPRYMVPPSYEGGRRAWRPIELQLSPPCRWSDQPEFLRQVP